MLETAAPSTTQPTALSWLTNWVSQPIELVPGFEIESIKPDPRPATVFPDNLLEITIWDLYDPGKPYTFPVRVAAQQTIEVPFLGEVPVEGRTIPEVEAGLAESYRKRDILLNPRILVRSLDSPTVKVQVTGAVNRSGFVELTRTDLSAYAAIVSAGGLKKTAGTQVAVTRRAVTLVSGKSPPPANRVDLSAAIIASGPENTAADDEPHEPAQRANSVEELSVPTITPAARPTSSNQALFAVDSIPGTASLSSAVPVEFPAAANSGPWKQPPANSSVPVADDTEQPAVWYDMALAPDREQLKLVRLADGDTVTVKPATPPLRIGGIVNRPGVYPLPPGRNINVWQAIDEAGGVRDNEVPLNITLLRPAAEGRSTQRLYLNVAAYNKHPTEAPLVEPGNVLQVEPTTGGKIKRAVGDLWSKP